MADVGEATNPPVAPGAAQYQAMVHASDVGTANQWKADEQQKLIRGGYSPNEAMAYFGDTPPSAPGVDAIVKNNMAKAPPPGAGTWDVDPLHAFQSGLDMSVTAQALRGGKPYITQPGSLHPSWTASLAAASGQMLGDLPANVAGFFAGTAAGGSAGAAVPVGGETGITEAVGGAFGAGFGMAATPTAMREAMTDAYNAGSIKTPGDFFKVVGASTVKILKDGVTGAAANIVGGAVGGKLAAAGAHAAVAAVAGTTANAVTGVTVGAAMSGQMPSKEDFVTAAASALIMHGLGSFAGAVKNGVFTPSSQALKVQNNLETLYRQTGKTPWEAVAASRSDPALRSELLNQDVNGEPNLAHLRNISPSEPQPYGTPQAAADEGGTPVQTMNPGAKASKPGQDVVASTPVGRFLGISTKLEGSGDNSISPVGAVGRHQIMPGTARQYMGSDYDVSKLMDPAENLRVATRIAQDLTRRYPNDEAAQMVAYNAGPGRANQLLTKGPGTRLEASLDPTIHGGVRYESVPSGRDESFLPLETQKYLANGRRITSGSLTEGNTPKVELGPQDQARASGEAPRGVDQVKELVAQEGGSGGGEPPEDNTPVVPPAERDYSDDLLYKRMNDDQATDEILRNVGEQPDPKGTPLSTQVGRFYSDLNPAREIDTRLIKDSGGTLDRNKDFMIEDGFRQTLGSDTRAGVFSRYGRVNAISLDIEPNSPSDALAMRALRDNGGKIDGLKAYMIAGRAKDLEAAGLDHSFNKPAVQRMRTSLDAKAKYGDAAGIFDQVNDGVLKYGRDSGLFNDARIKAMKDASPLGFVRFAKIADEPDMAGSGGTRGKYKVSDPLSRTTADGGMIEDPIRATLENRRMIVRMADRNRAIGQIVALAEGAPQLAENIGLKRLKFDPVAQLAATAEDDFKPYGVDAEQGQAAYQFLLAQKASHGFNPNEFLYFRNGVPERWTTSDPQVAEMIKRSSSPQEADAAVKVLSTMASIQRSGIVLDPSFVPRVLLRHQMTAFTYDPLHPPPYITAIRGVMSVLTKDEKFQSLLAKGGLGTSLVEMDTDRLSKDIDDVFNKTNVFGKITNAFLHPIQFSQAVHEAMDAAPRVGYSAFATDQGIDPIKAATMGRKAYLDYSERASVEAVNRMAKNVPFFRPTMLGQKQAMEAFTENNVKGSGIVFKTLTAATIGILVPNLLMYAANYFQDKTLPEGQQYNDIPRWVKDEYFVTPLINGNRFKMKYPPILGMPLGGMVNRALDFMLKDDPHAFDGMMTGFMKEFCPPLLPTVAEPPLEVVTNHSFNSGNALTPASVEKASGYMQYTEATTAPAKAIAQILGPTRLNVPGLNKVSPIQIETLVQGWTGTEGMALMHALDAPFKPVEPGNMSTNPFVGSFFLRNPGTSSQVITDFYADKDELERRNVDFKDAIRNIDEGGIQDTLALGGVQGVKGLAGISVAVNKMLGFIHAANEDKTMTVDEKRQIIDQALPQVIDLAKEGTKLAQEIRKDARDSAKH